MALDDALRRRVIAEWRGLAEPPEKRDRCSPVGALVQKLVASLQLDERLTEQQITAAWRDVVGDFLAQHSTPSSLSKGVLIVQVLQPAVRYELDRTWKPHILEKLGERFGRRTVREIRFRV